jgi:hypothetical protein
MERDPGGMDSDPDFCLLNLSMAKHSAGIAGQKKIAIHSAINYAA